MTDDRDPVLKSLFAESQHDLDGEAFTARVMDRTRYLRYRTLAVWGSVGLALAVGASLFAVPLQTAQLIAEVLTTALIDLGDGWLAWVLSPVNSVAALLAVSVKAIRVCRKKIITASYAN
ncbi:MAG: hypothetical protein O7H39_14230 [Gammaproteobacteria bacterium]|nr:hypothetical protein [Gammaproteobacteria bacterium]